MGCAQHRIGMDMLIKLRLGVVLASACLFSVLASSDVVAQDATSDPEPATEAVASDPTIYVAAPDPEVELASVPPTVIAAARTTMAIPAPNESTGYESYSDSDLTQSAADYTQGIAELVDAIAGFLNPVLCHSSCEVVVGPLYEERDAYQNILDHLNEEIRRREVGVVTPDPAPVTVAASVARRDKTADATPSRAFCAALAASGDRSDCGWSYRQSLKP